jgi:GH25 family lysozyme M1 (1,4-beta-N-acetylmuramidase)
MYAPDYSNWQWPQTLETYQCAKERGCGHVIIRASLESARHIEIARAQMAFAQQAGLGLSGYLWCYWHQDPVQAVHDCLETYRDFPFHTLWLDAEDTEGAHSPEVVIDWLRRAIEAARGRNQRVGIYTGAWFWKQYVGNSPELGDVPLWDANYDGEPRSPFQPYGGWTSRAVHQFNSAYDLCGQAIDMNWIDDAYLQPEGVDWARIKPLLDAVWDANFITQQRLRDLYEELRRQVPGSV